MANNELVCTDYSCEGSAGLSPIFPHIQVVTVHDLNSPESRQHRKEVSSLEQNFPDRTLVGEQADGLPIDRKANAIGSQFEVPFGYR